MRLRDRLYSAMWRAFLCALVLYGYGRGDAAERLPEYSVKAMFLYNFIKFTEWPAGSRKEIGLCVFGMDLFGEALDKIEGKTAHGLPVRIKRDVKVEETKDCQLLFINEPDRPRLLRLLRQLEGASVLTVAESEGFVQSGGMIGLVLEDNRVQFHINIKTVERGRIKISAQLLKLARQVLQ